jgi:cytochrome c oxidase assembly factor CtaG
LHHPRDGARLICFLAGLIVLFLASESPLDSFDTLLLSAHMAQHLLLMMIAPALLLWSEPALPLLRGLPRSVTKEALGPFLTWPALRQFFHWLTSPVVTWIAFAGSTVLWHLPAAYELALGNPNWHAFQHASFFWTGVLFWWPIIRPGPVQYPWPEWVGIPYLLFADLVNTALSAVFVFSGKLLYPTYAAVRLAGLTAADDQTLAGAIMWVPGSIVYLLPAAGLAMRLLTTPHAPQVKATRVARSAPRGWSIKTVAQWRPLAQIGMLALAVLVMLDGFFGVQTAPLNLAGVLPWIHWRAATVIALLLVGNLFCFACPFIFVRDLARKLLPARFRWPHMLRTKWVTIALFVVYLWTYEAYSLWQSPYLTAWLIAGYFLGAIAIDGFFRGASFCKYVCPIGQFHFVTSLVSPREVSVRKQSVCNSCRTYDCIRGNARQRGCETYLFQPKKTGNFDCTFCLDCVKACPHDNVGLIQIVPGATATVDPYRSSIGRLSKRFDWAALALVLVFGAFVNAAGMISPVTMYEHSWHVRLGSMRLVVGVFIAIGVIVIPAILAALFRNVTRFAYALVPLGVGMWGAHFLFHFLSYAGDGAPRPVELLLLDAGLLGALYLCWRIGKQVKGAAPWFAISCALYAVGVWIVFQPMEMRGMMMS